MPLSNLEYVSNVEVDKLNPGVANRIKDGMAVGSLDEAHGLIEAYQEELALQGNVPSEAANNASASNVGSSSEANSSQSDNQRESNGSASQTANNAESGD